MGFLEKFSIFCTLFGMQFQKTVNVTEKKYSTIINPKGN